MQVAGRWENLARADYNYWLAAAGAGPGPFTVRLTDTAGHQVTVPGIALEPGVVQDTGIRMYGAGALAAPVAAAPGQDGQRPRVGPGRPAATGSGDPHGQASADAHVGGTEPGTGHGAPHARGDPGLLRGPPLDQGELLRSDHGR